MADVCASFQRAVVEALLDRTFDAARWLDAKSVGIAGGVSANSRLRQDALARGERDGIPVFVPSLALTTDNAAMIAAAGLRRLRRRRHRGHGPQRRRRACRYERPERPDHDQEAALTEAALDGRAGRRASATAREESSPLSLPPDRRRRRRHHRRRPRRPHQAALRAAGGAVELPGGTLEVGETLEAGVAREMLEETGLDVEVGR